MISRRDILRLGTAGLMLPAIESMVPAGVSANQTKPGTVPMYRGNAARTSEMPGPAPDFSNGIGVRWQFATGDQLRTSPAVADGVAYVGSGDGSLYAVSLQDGAEIWRFPAGDRVELYPTVVDGTVFFGSADQNVHAVDASTGDERWRLPIGPNAGSPAVVDGMVLVSGGEQGQMNLFALDAQDGTEIWRFPVDSYWNLVPAVAESTVFLSTGPSVQALDLHTGEEIWRVPYDGRDAPFGSELAVVSNTVYASGGGTSAFDAQDGTELWRTPPDQFITGAIAVAGDTLVAGSGEYHTVAAADVRDGSRRWLYAIDGTEPDPAKPSRYGFSNVAIAGDTVLATRAFNEIYAFDVRDGSDRWTFQLHTEGGKNVLSLPVIVDGLVLVGCSDGNLYALGAL